MPYITEVQAKRIAEMANDLCSLSGDPLFNADAGKVYIALVKLLETALISVCVSSETSAEIEKIIQKEIREHGLRNSDLDSYQLTLPPLLPSSNLPRSLAANGADLLTRKTIAATTKIRKVPSILASECVVVFIHHAPLDRKFDYDNRAFKVYLDNLADAILDADHAQNIDLFQMYQSDPIASTEVHFVPRSGFAKWVEKHHNTTDYK